MPTNIDIILPAAIALAIVVFIVLGLGYYLLFVYKREAPLWKSELEQKLKSLIARQLNKEHMVMELDKLVEFAFKKKFNSRDNLGQILKDKRSKFDRRTLNDIWTAHKLRNKIAHDIDYKPKPNELNQAIITFKQLINNLITE